MKEFTFFLLNTSLFHFFGPLQANPRKMLSAAAGIGDDSTIDPKNFATIRTTSIVQRQQKEHLQEEMHDQMSGYKRMRRDHQAALARLEENCRQEMEKHKNLLDREYEQLLTQFSKDLERLQLRYQEELSKRVRKPFFLPSFGKSKRVDQHTFISVMIEDLSVLSHLFSMILSYDSPFRLSVVLQHVAIHSTLYQLWNKCQLTFASSIDLE